MLTVSVCGVSDRQQRKRPDGEIVPKVGLDFNFTTKLMLDGGFEQLSLLDYLRLQTKHTREVNTMSKRDICLK
jgi:hypothetical protein